MKGLLVGILILSVFLLLGCQGGSRPVAEEDELLRQVTIYRDTYGVPHVFGETEEAAFFGDGYEQARERILELARAVLAARGRLAEVFGQSQLESDYRSRLFRIYPVAEEKYPTLPREVRRAVEAFVQGVNYYIAEHRTQLPEWVQPLAPIDVVAVYRLRLRPPADGFSSSGSSNSWVTAKDKSASGNVVLVADPHTGWAQSREIHIKGGELDVAGLMQNMLVWIGHNQYVAWGGSANRPALIDIYEEKLNPQNPYQYLYEGEWRPMRVIKEKIPVRSDSGVREVERELLYTHHGPVIRVDKARNLAYAVKMPGFESVDMVAAHYRVAKAKNMQELKAVLATLDLVNVPNVVAGDRQGNIFYVYYGKVPIRSENYDWTRPVPGWTQETEWQGFIPFEQLPQVENPPSHFLQTSNEAPWLVTPNSGLSENPQDYPAYLVPRGLGPTWRGRRLTELLSSQERFTLDQLRQFAFDTYIGMAETLKGLIFTAYEEEKDTLGALSEPTAKAVALLRGWDNVSRKESAAMTIFKLWFERYRGLGGTIRVGERKEPTPGEKQRAFQALTETVEFMLKQYGSVAVEWEKVHVLQRGDKVFPMGAADFEFQTVHMASASIIPPAGYRGLLQSRYEDGVWYTHSGSSYMFMVELGEPVRAWSVKPFGQSGDPGSPYFADQTELFSRMEMKPLWFSEEEVRANLESAWGLKMKVGAKGLGYEAELAFERPLEVQPQLTEQAPAPLPDGWQAVSGFLTLAPGSLGPPSKVQGQVRFYLPLGVTDAAVFRLSGGEWQPVERGGRAEDSVWAEVDALGTYVALEREVLRRGSLPDNDEIYGWIRDLSAHGPRRPGTEAGNRAEQYLAEKLRQFGFQDVRLEPIDVTVWTAERWGLTVAVEGQKRSVPSFFIPYTGFTDAAGVTAELVYLGEGAPEDYWQESVQGKVVVVDIRFATLSLDELKARAYFTYDPQDTLHGGRMMTWVMTNWGRAYRLAVENGAVGFIGILKDMPANINSHYAPYDGVLKPLPGLYVGRDDGAKLREWLSQGRVTGTLVLVGMTQPGVTHNIIGVLPGKTDKIIMVGSHHDSPFMGAVEDASGTAEVLALAKYFASQPPRTYNRTLVFSLRAGHFYGGIGARTFYEQHRDDILSKVVVNFVLEHMGKDFVERDNQLVDTGLFGPAGLFVPDDALFSAIASEAVKRHRLERVMVLPRGVLGVGAPGDGTNYPGVPTVNIISGPYYLLVDIDTLDKVALDYLQPVAAAFAEMVERMDRAAAEASE